MDTKPRTSLSDDCSTATSSGAQFDTDEVTSQLLKVRLLYRDPHCFEILDLSVNCTVLKNDLIQLSIRQRYGQKFSTEINLDNLCV